jgi:hypothetical protein
MNERAVRRYAAFLVCLLSASAGCSQPAANRDNVESFTKQVNELRGRSE